MNDNGMRDCRKILLVYALAGPLVGLLGGAFFSPVHDLWGVAVDQVEVLLSDLHAPRCRPQDLQHVDLLCFQRISPRRLEHSGGLPDFALLPVTIIGAYIVGLVPALAAGSLMCVVRLHYRCIGFIHAVLVATLIGLVTGAVFWYPRHLHDDAAFFFFVCFISTIVCWFVTKRWCGKAEITDAE